MKTEEYPKTHYELVKTFPNMDRLFGCDFESLMKKLGEQCGSDPDFISFAESPMISENLLGKLDISTETLFVNVYYHAYRMYANGENIYNISPGLCADLSNTKLSISPYFLKAPFPETYIQIPKGVYHLVQEGRSWPVSGFYVSLRELEDETKEIRILVYAEDSKVINEYGMPDDTLFYFKLHIKGDTFEEAMKDIVEEQVAKNKKDLFMFGGASNAHFITTFFEFIFNTLLYITSKDPDVRKHLPPDYNNPAITNKGKLRKLAKRAKKHTHLPILVVGKDFKNKTSIEDIRNEGSVNKWRLSKKVRVSGYWKLQWYGSKKDGSREAKPIFVSSYTKGPDTAEMLGKTYKVGRK